MKSSSVGKVNLFKSYKSFFICAKKIAFILYIKPLTNSSQIFTEEINFNFILQIPLKIKNIFIGTVDFFNVHILNLN